MLEAADVARLDSMPLGPGCGLLALQNRSGSAVEENALLKAKAERNWATRFSDVSL